jgi:hypothetical protein
MAVTVASGRLGEGLSDAWSDVGAGLVIPDDIEADVPGFENEGSRDGRQVP